MEIIPWEKLSEEVIQVGHRSIVSKTFQLPDGSVGKFEIVGKPDSATVCILALTSENKIIIAEQFRPGLEVVLQELPPGKIEKDETPLVAGQRELLEETGYIGKFIYMGKSYSSAYMTNTKHYFIATNCKKKAEPQPEQDEFINVKLVDLDEFLKIIDSGEMTDLDCALLGLHRFRSLFSEGDIV